MIGGCCNIAGYEKSGASPSSRLLVQREGKQMTTRRKCNALAIVWLGASYAAVGDPWITGDVDRGGATTTGAGFGFTGTHNG